METLISRKNVAEGFLPLEGDAFLLFFHLWIPRAPTRRRTSSQRNRMRPSIEKRPFSAMRNSDLLRNATTVPTPSLSTGNKSKIYKRSAKGFDLPMIQFGHNFSDFGERLEAQPRIGGTWISVAQRSTAGGHHHLPFAVMPR